MIRTLIIIYALALTISNPKAEASDSQNIYKVPANFASVVRLNQNAAGVVVGNHTIADATMFDARTVLITGKVYGHTNLIVLNSSGQIIHKAHIAVTENNSGLVQVYRNTNRFSYVCNPVCQTVPMVGDEFEGFGNTQDQRTEMIESGEN